MWECPTSSVPDYIWDTISLFFLCYSRSQGFSGWVLQRMTFPHEGTPLDQDSWLMWAFDFIEQCFYELQADRDAERENAEKLKAAHRNMRAHG